MVSHRKMEQNRMNLKALIEIKQEEQELIALQLKLT
jgi:hypothetical protein